MRGWPKRCPADSPPGLAVRLRCATLYPKRPRRGGDHNHAKAYMAAACGGGQHAVRAVFRGGEPDLPGGDGPAGGAQPLGGRGRLPDHRRRAAAAGRGGARPQPGIRPAGAQQPGGARVRACLYLRFVPDHRAVFCNPALRHRLLHRGHRAAGAGRRGGAGRVFACVFCGGAVLFAAAGPDPDLGGQGAQPAVPGVFGGAGAARAGCAAGAGRGGGTRRRVPGRAVCHRPVGRLQHDGCAGRPGLRHFGGAGHPAAGGARARRCGGEHGLRRGVQLRPDGGHLPALPLSARKAAAGLRRRPTAAKRWPRSRRPTSAAPAR